jgi:hypothetical protein
MNQSVKKIDGLIDYCLTFSEQYFNYIQDEKKFNNIYKKYIETTEGWVKRVNDFWLPLKSWIGTKILSFVAAPMRLLFFLNLQKMSLTCRERDSL